MPAYYNEIDHAAADWLRALIARGLIPAGDVDERSIVDVQPGDLTGFDQCHFFAGIGGWPYALRLAGWRGPVWTGSCPCQPLSSAGQRKGHADQRHLWPAFHALIAECRPATVFGEQVASRDGREWLAGVRADLEAAGYAVGAADLCAASSGAPHIRQRLFWVADAKRAPVRGQPRDDRSETGASKGETRQRQRLWSNDSADGATGGLADAGHAIGRPLNLNGEHGRDGADGGRAEAHGEPGARGEVRGLGDAAGGRCLGSRENHTKHAAPGSLELSNTQHDRLAGEGRALEDPGFWDDAVWLACLDGKARRVEPTIQPLADVRGCICGRRLGQSCTCDQKPSRVSMLRGAGNAISPPVAAEFIKAFVECQGGD